MKVALIIAALVTSLSISITSCSSFGPTPMVNVVKSEVKETKKVKGILFANPIGLEADGGETKAYALAAAGTYPPPNGIPADAVSKMLSSLGLSEDMVAATFVGFQAEFSKHAHEFAASSEKDKKAKSPEKMPLPKAGFQVPKNLDAAKDLSKKLKTFEGPAKEMAEALKGSDGKKLAELVETHKDFVGHMNALARLVLNELKVTYLALSLWNGNEADYKAKKRQTLTVALLNVKSGTFRYFATVEGTKGQIPVPYREQIGLITNAIYSGADEKAPLPGS